MHPGRSLPCLLSLVTAVTQLGACTVGRNLPNEAAAPAVALDPTTPPAIMFAGLERRLLDAPSLHVRYTVRSEGAFNSSLSGTLHLTQHPSVDLEAEGVFGDAPATLRLRSDAQAMEGGSAQRTFREATPPALREALILGLTRMGILHNLARLTGGAAPDHASGGIREWVEVREVQRGSNASGATPDWLALRFPIHVSGARTAEATLWLDRRTGLPVRRQQVVTFPNGSMRVIEQYDFVP